MVAITVGVWTTGSPSAQKRAKGNGKEPRGIKVVARARAKGPSKDVGIARETTMPEIAPRARGKGKEERTTQEGRRDTGKGNMAKERASPCGVCRSPVWEETHTMGSTGDGEEMVLNTSAV